MKGIERRFLLVHVVTPRSDKSMIGPTHAGDHGREVGDLRFLRLAMQFAGSQAASIDYSTKATSRR